MKFIKAFLNKLRIIKLIVWFKGNYEYKKVNKGKTMLKYLTCITLLFFLFLSSQTSINGLLFITLLSFTVYIFLKHKKELENLKKEIETNEAYYLKEIAGHAQSIKKLKSSHKDLIKKQENLLSEAFTNSAETTYFPQIKDMQAQNDKLNEQLILLKEQAKVFDVNFDDKKFNGLLKGRQFEIFVASTFHHKHGCEILEWTPDKGFNKGIKVKINENADLLLKDKDGHIFAVECKYRGDYYFYTRNEIPSPKELSWGTRKQGYNYKKYGEEKSADVYVAIGFRGDASNPESNFLVPLNKLFTESVVKRHQNKNNYVLTLDSISEFKIENNNFYDLVSCEVEV